MTTGERERERESQQSFLLHNIFIFVASSFPTIVCKKCSFFLEESATKALVSSQGMEHESKIQVPRVKLGAQGLEVSRLGFGCGGLSGILNAPLSHEAGCSILKEAFHKGITFFDTADVCGQKHDNEIMIGKALKQLPREQVQLATKCGIISVDWTHVEVKGTPDYVQQCCEASLKRLDVDYIDLFYTHRVDLSLPIEDTSTHPRFSGENLEKNKILYARFADLAAKHGCSPPQLALAWLFHQGNDVVPIPGTTKIKNLDANIESVAVKLTQEDLKEISDAIPIDEVSGVRELDFLSRYTYRSANTPPKK
ncbi:hypothetical protein ACSBR2_013265 [Camellia fascicularis]